MVRIDHCTVVCLVAWRLNECEAGVDLVLIESSLFFLCKFILISMRSASLGKAGRFLSKRGQHQSHFQKPERDTGQ